MDFDPIKPQQGAAGIPNYEEETKNCVDFLGNFTRDDGSFPYKEQLQAVANRHSRVVEIDLDDVEEFFQTDKADKRFVRSVELNVMRYVQLWSDAIDELMPEPTMDTGELDVADVLLQHRQRAHSAAQNQLDIADPLNSLPKQLLRRYHVHVIPRSMNKPLSVRTVKAKHIGSLVKIQGIITRMSDVRPKIEMAVYTCDVCGNEIYQEVNGKTYMPLVECQSADCVANKNKGRLVVMHRGSRFIQFQELRLQELPEHVPIGNVPRSMSVYVVGPSTRVASAGDKVTIHGAFLPMAKTGFRAMKAGLTATTYLHGFKITKQKKGYDLGSQPKEVLEQVNNMAGDTDIYSKLAQSVAPEIHGLDDVKKALVCLMVGGVTKSLDDGLKIRGDVNILLMGDPGVAKSQLLKFIERCAPRAVYTTGKGSSGVGLTAAVLRDDRTGEMVLEGGALVLADMGVCCIDEFDKMEDQDRTAIYEVMEQQSVSIAKAGITTTLNARAAILAAANPTYGRYNKKLGPEKNITLPAALLSRFDLLFVMVDTPDPDNDERLAAHITYVHRMREPPVKEFEPFSPAFIRAYIAKARQYEPWVPKHLMEHIVGSYVQMRQQANDLALSRMMGTPRTLLSILRLSQALARINLRNEVVREDIEEATRLMRSSKASTMDDDQRKKQTTDSISAIYSYIKDYAAARSLKSVKRTDLIGGLSIRGYSDEQIEESLKVYTDLNVLMVTEDAIHVMD